jgi:hypothetical protein
VVTALDNDVDRLREFAKEKGVDLSEEEERMAGDPETLKKLFGSKGWPLMEVSRRINEGQSMARRIGNWCEPNGVTVENEITPRGVKDWNECLIAAARAGLRELPHEKEHLRAVHNFWKKYAQDCGMTLPPGCKDREADFNLLETIQKSPAFNKAEPKIGTIS